MTGMHCLSRDSNTGGRSPKPIVLGMSSPKLPEQTVQECYGDRRSHMSFLGSPIAAGPEWPSVSDRHFFVNHTFIVFCFIIFIFYFYY